MASFYISDFSGPEIAGKDGGLFDSLVDAAGGKPLPGRWGLAQAILNAASQPKHNVHPALHWPKVALNVAGVVRIYQKANDPTAADTRKDPIRDYLAGKGVRVPDGWTNLASFILSYSHGYIVEDVTPGGTTTGEWVRWFKLPSGVSYAFKMWKGSDYWGAGEVGTGPYLAGADADRFEHTINEIVWKATGDADLELTVRSKGSYSANAFMLSAIGEPDAYIHNEVTALSGAIVRCEAFRARGISRNLLFYGPPGTGKTTLARSIARSVGGGRTLRVEANAFANAGVSAVLGFIRILRPRVVLFDDMDRCMSNIVELLHCLEQGGALADVDAMLVGTINVVSQVDPALLRPGRFDEVIEIAEPGDAHRERIVNHYLAAHGLSDDLTQSITAATVGFSPADIREIVQAVAVVGADHADAEIARVGRQRALYAGDKCEEYQRRTAPTMGKVPG